MPDADVAKALFVSTFDSSNSWLLQSVMVLRVLSPVTVQRLFTASEAVVCSGFRSFDMESNWCLKARKKRVKGLICVYSKPFQSICIGANCSVQS